MRISEETYNKFKKNKYHNKITYLDDIKFDSKKESSRYVQLKQLEKLGIIKELELQKKFELQEGFKDNVGNTIRPISYYADFYYYDNIKKIYIAEDVKSAITKKDKTYCLKKKMFLHKYREILFVEI